MGTHGRNAVTRNGHHLCCEQTMDGHYAADDMILPFLRRKKDEPVPMDLYPTMEDSTDECDHSNFGHVDYDRKIIYSSWGVWALARLSMRERHNLIELRKDDWRVAFGVNICPREYKCVNSPRRRWDSKSEKMVRCQAADIAKVLKEAEQFEKSIVRSTGVKIKRSEVNWY